PRITNAIPTRRSSDLKKDYPLPGPYEVALKDSTRFVFEFDPSRGDEFEKKFEAAAKYPRGQDIRSKIDPTLLSWLRQNILTVNRSEEQTSELQQLAYL